jgi:hypothetical protein
VIEALESRQFLDATTFAVSNPNSSDYYGTVNQADPSGVWGHTWGVSQNNVPAHTHTQASIETEVVVNVDPNTGLSLTSGTQDDGYIFVTFNGQPVGDPILIPAGTTEDTWLGGTVMSNADQEGWQISTTDNVFIKVDNGSIQQGTSAGFAHGVEADRGGQDGSETLSLDGPAAGNTTVYVKMPSSGIINLHNQTPDDQLPNDANGNQPYFTITGPDGIELDTADSHPELGFNVYKIGVTQGTSSVDVGFHMVTPFMHPDYQNGIYVSILEQPGNNVIPISGGWWDANANTFWAKDGGPDAKGLYMSDHVQGEITDAHMDELVGQLNGVMSADRDAARNELIAAVQAVPSAHVLTRLTGASTAAGLSPEQQRQMGLVMQMANPLGITYDPQSGLTLRTRYTWPSGTTPVIDNDHKYSIGLTSDDGSMSPVIFPSGFAGPRIQDYWAGPSQGFPGVYPFPVHAGNGKMTIDVMMWKFSGGGWAFVDEVKVNVLFTLSNDQN